MENSSENATILKVEGLRTYFYTDIGIVKAVDGVDLKIRKQEIFGLVGESASGKSVLALSIMGLIPKPAGRIISGKIIFKGRNLLELLPKEMRRIRGNQISMIPQDPTTALNPLYNVGFQIWEVFRYHRDLGKAKILEKIVELLKVVNIPSPRTRLNDYPHQLSGGLKQRVIIATALSCEPDLLIADEPTSALDVTIQLQIIKLIKKIREQYRMNMLLITHNLGIVAKMCDRVAILYCGRIVEEARVGDIFRSPRHPYTKGLLASLPRGQKGRTNLYTIPGQNPSPLNRPDGCGFRTRCPHAIPTCTDLPPTEMVTADHTVRCWRWKELSV